MSDFILFNGQFFKQQQSQFSADYFHKLLFRESFRTICGKPVLWNEHLALINIQLQLFHSNCTGLTDNNGYELLRQTERLLRRNKYYKSAIIEASFFYNEKNLQYLLESVFLNTTDYLLPAEGIEITLSHRIYKSVSPVSCLKSGSFFYWNILQHQKQKEETTLLLQNTSKSIVEAPWKNIFVICGQNIYTPSPSTGAYVDPAKKTIEEICNYFGYHFQEVNFLNENDLLNADEIFLANTTHGMQWVRAYEQKRYFNKKTKLINTEFNRRLVQ